MPLRRTAVALVLLLCMSSGVVALASTQPRWVSETVHPRWRIISHNGEETNGSYTLLYGAPGVVGTLIDERTGRRVRLLLPRICSKANQSLSQLGDSWLLEKCSHSRLDLYSLARRAWRPVRIASSCRHYNGGPGSGCTPFAVGTDWIEYDVSSDGLGDRFLFQNIASGTVRRDPTTARTIPDLNSPTLARRVCKPLRVPPTKTQARLTVDGRFAVIASPADSFLERCGTGLHLSLTGGLGRVAVSPAAIVWPTGPRGRLRGISLPSLARFTVALPPAAFDIIWVDLTARHIYLDAMTRQNVYDVWSAPSPAL